MLFDERNLKDVVYKLNGGAEVFFRKSSIDESHRITHPANSPIVNKNELNPKKHSLFTYDIVKDRRYTVDQFLFHVPITMNFKAEGISIINPLVNEMIREGKIEHIIGIDRGERHLLYLSLIDLRGNIVKQMTLNDIVTEYKGISYQTDYHGLLVSKEGKLKDARKNWDTIETIKELKEGYMSQVIHVITKMMIEYNAIVVLEDLNKGFMRGRQKVERQVYEKFEKMLIDKLNYVVDKHVNPENETGLLHALQLTNDPKKSNNKSLQNGCLFYIPAWNTSKIDPVTGFVNLFDTRYENVDCSRLFFSHFDSIRFNPSTNEFEFKFNYDNFTSKAEGTKTHWTITSYGSRIITFRNPDKNSQWDSKEVDLSEAFLNLFKQ
jgi:CRISPR-associated protein Cpf1